MLETLSEIVDEGNMNMRAKVLYIKSLSSDKIMVRKGGMYYEPSR